MLLYAELAPRRARQVLADVAGVIWCVLAALLGRAVHDAVAALASAGADLERAGEDIAGRLDDAATALAGVPLVGRPVAGPLAQAADAAQRAADAGRAQQELVLGLAPWLGTGVAALLVMLAVLVWVAPRARWAVRAAAARSVRAQPGGVDLLALRALARRPVRQLGPAALVAGGPALDLVGGWRHREPAVLHRLASLELQALGLAPAWVPPPPVTAPAAAPPR